MTVLVGELALVHFHIKLTCACLIQHVFLHDSDSFRCEILLYDAL